MDPILEETVTRAPRTLEQSRKAWDTREQSKRGANWLSRWAWTELPAYRLSLLLGYTFTVYFGVSALIAGVPAFTTAAPEGWTLIWATLLVIAGPVGLFGTLRETPRFRKIELWASVVQSGALFVYAGTVLFIAYSAGDDQRVTSGAALAWLASLQIVRMIKLIAEVSADRKLVQKQPSGE